MAFLIACLAPMVVQAQGIQTDDEDEFTGARRIVSEGAEAEQDSFVGTAMIMAAYGGGQRLLLLTISSQESWQALGTRKARLLADSEGDEPIRMEVQLERLDSEVDSGTTYEQMGIFLSSTQWTELQTGSNLRIRIDGIVYTVPDVILEEMALVEERIE